MVSSSRHKKQFSARRGLPQRKPLCFRRPANTFAKATIAGRDWMIFLRPANSIPRLRISTWTLEWPITSCSSTRKRNRFWKPSFAKIPTIWLQHLFWERSPNIRETGKGARALRVCAYAETAERDRAERPGDRSGRFGKRSRGALSLARSFRHRSESVGRSQLGRALRNMGRSKESLHEMALYQSIRDRDHIVQTLVSPDKASQNEHWRECEKLLKENGESAAVAYVNSVAAETHSQLDAYYMVGMFYSAQRRNEDAIRVLNKAAEVSPNNADVVAFLGHVYIRDHNYEQSELDLKRALEMSPLNQIALVGMGELQYMRGQWTEAARYFDESHTQEVSALLLMCNA